MKNQILAIFFIVGVGGLSLAQSDGPGWVNPFTSPAGRADFREKAQTKQDERWTLADWMAQKDRSRMMDLWLSMSTPGPYELILTGTYFNESLTTDVPAAQSLNARTAGDVAFYALILGVEGFYENNWNEAFTDSGGNINLRILGKHVQNTHLILQYGLRNRNATAYTLQQQFAGVDLDLYIEKHSGLHGNYRSFLPTTNSFLGSVSGNRWEAALFFNVNFIQIFGGWQSEVLTITQPNNQQQTRSGLWSGLKLFF